MARLNTFYLDSPSWPAEPDGLAYLEGAEARHLLTVLRTETGDTVRLIDGAGKVGLFSLVEAGKKRAILKAIEITTTSPHKNGVTLAIGWGKSKRRNYLFEKTVELHGDGIIFWPGARSQGSPPTHPKDSWKDKCVQAAKQCGNELLPQLEVLSSINDLKELTSRFDHCYLAWESGEDHSQLAPSHLASGKTLIVIGPEGGFDNEEAEKIISFGLSPVSLGNSILRWETAATYCLSLGYYAKQDRS